MMQTAKIKTRVSIISSPRPRLPQPRVRLHLKKSLRIQTKYPKILHWQDLHLLSAIVAPVFTALWELPTITRPDFVLATYKRGGIVRAFLALSIHLFVMAKVFSTVVTFRATTSAVVSTNSQIYFPSAALMSGWVVIAFSTKGVDEPVITEEKARVVRLQATALCMAAANASDHVTITALKVEI